MMVSIRDRSREAVRSELAEAIVVVFIKRGYASVTVEDAAREVGISRATFFRYFGSKEDVVVASVDSARVDYKGALDALPVKRGQSAWTLVRAAVEPVVVTATSDSETLRARLRMIANEPALKRKLLERRAENTEALTVALSDRLKDLASAKLFAAAGLAAVDVAWETWTSSDDGDFRGIIDGIFERLENGAPISTR